MYKACAGLVMDLDLESGFPLQGPQTAIPEEVASEKSLALMEALSETL
jgi:hypothetical protein